MNVSTNILLKPISFVALMLLMILIDVDSVLAASATGEMRQKVVRRISIANISGLDFGIASPGDKQKIIEPDTKENPYNASFIVRGESNTAFFIHLPQDGSVEMKVHGGSNRDMRIAVNTFKSFPQNFGNLAQSGSQMLYVGATRDELTQTQHPGDYVGYFTVTVVY